MSAHVHDPDPQETAEWLEAMRGVLAAEGPDRARALIGRIVDEAQRGGAHVSLGFETRTSTPFRSINSQSMPGSRGVGASRHCVLNAMAMVVRQQSEFGTRRTVASFCICSNLAMSVQPLLCSPSEVRRRHGLQIQGPRPRRFARAFLEGRIDEHRLENFRQKSTVKELPSYPHPWLMPDFCNIRPCRWGSAIMSIYQARFMRCDRGLRDTSGQRCGVYRRRRTDGPNAQRDFAGARKQTTVWVSTATCSASTGRFAATAIHFRTGRRLPTGAGWNVIKVIWGSSGMRFCKPIPQPLCADDETVDSDYQTFKSARRQVRARIFNAIQTAQLVEH